MAKKIPLDLWKSACENIREPLAVVGVDNKFLWVNQSFEKLTGYPEAELLSMTWIDITSIDDVGSDLASVANIINGKSDTYTMDKRYLHRRGHEIDVTIIVRRWPSEPEQITMFYVEAIPPVVTKSELENIISELKSRITKIEKYADDKEDIPDQKNSHASNEALRIRYFAIGFLALIGMMMYLFYCLVKLQLNESPIAPPTIPTVYVESMKDVIACLNL